MLCLVAMLTNIYVIHLNIHNQSSFQIKQKDPPMYFWLYLNISVRG